MTFEEYLVSKKINGEAFRLAYATTYETWRLEFDEMHDNSFTSQKLFLINKIRRQFQLTISPPLEAKEIVVPAKINIRPKIN